MYSETKGSAKIRSYSEINTKQIDWLWFPYIAYGKVTVIQGDPGVGKTTLALNIAALLSAGNACTECISASCEPQNVIYQSAENGFADTIKPRLLNAGADCSKISFVNDVYNPLTLNDERLEAAIRKCNAKLLVLDSLEAFTGVDSDLRVLLKQLGKIAECTGCAVIIISTADMTGIARNVLLVSRVNNNPFIRVMVGLKNTFAPEGSPIAFELNEINGFRWIGNVKSARKTDDLYWKSVQ
jgi:predicted ATP-dependent serine protease